MLQYQKCTYERSLCQLNNQLATISRVLSSLRISCEGERIEIGNLCNEKIRIEVIVTEFKNNNVEYLNIKQVAEEYVKSVLTNGKLLLKFATLSVIESLRRNPELCNFLLNDISNNNHTTTSNGSNYLSLMSREQRQQSFSHINDPYAALILEEAEKLYSRLTTKLTNEVMTAAAADIRAS
jgi:hypothetical protein